MRILLIEDDLKIAEYISKALRSEGFEVVVCHDGPTGLKRGSSEQYDAAVVDIMLPGMDGLQVIEALCERGITTPVLILSARQSVDDRIQGLQRGGDDYLVKPFAISELLARLQALMRRNSRASEPTVLKVADLEMDLLRREVTRAGVSIELPAKEYALLELLVRHAGAILSKMTILEKVYGYSFDPQTNVVDVLVFRLRNKIDKEFEPKLVQTVRGVGYVLKAPD